ncbi:hypothetical protein ScPMuIL_009259 [Solemya velum]
MRTVELTAGDAACTSASGASSPSNISSHIDEKMTEEASKLSEQKSKTVKGPDEETWRESIHKQMEEELSQRVREALETPPLERMERQKNVRGNEHDLKELNSHILFNLTDKDEYLRSRRWRASQAKRQMRKIMSMDYISPSSPSRIEFMFKDELSRSNQDEFPGVFGLNTFSENSRENENHFHVERLPLVRSFQQQFYTKNGFIAALHDGKFPDGTPISKDGNGCYTDQYGVVRNEDGPFWPAECTPLFATPHFQWWLETPREPLQFFVKNQQPTKTVDNQDTQFTGKWRGVIVVFDSERSSRDNIPQQVSDGCCSSLQFESRFESGNLRQARRVGQFEYELVLKTDLYTNRHTQWYYFRVQNVVPGITYKLRIINLLKKDSLYNYGMRPLVYSEKDAKMKGIGWVRTGHHIYYSRNVMHMHCPLLVRGIPYYELEWQMEFGNENDTYYLAHCYPYTYTDLKEDLDILITDPDRSRHIKREVLCETKAGNSCFLLTVTDFDDCKDETDKKAVVVTARVHPGESQASWMMKGLLDFMTGTDPVAKELRSRFVFKIVPMLNPDGVIIGNYRCSLAARDLNRNYRHPRRENFPTVYHTKQMVDNVLQKHEILLYCDLHGHSRKHNVFMYGNITSEEELSGIGAARAFLNDRLFPWLMAQKAPDKFSFSSCKFAIKRCKESTGRVVMWRQHRIPNSFTLEATFSGTVIDDECRHFNIKDFISMGESLCQAVLEYQSVQESKTRQTEIVLELTRFITHQVLRQRGISLKLPNLRALARAERAANMPAELPGGSSQEENELDVMGSEQMTEAIASYLSQSEALPRERKHRKHTDEDKLPHTKLEVDEILDSASLETMDGCLEILAQLNVQENVTESDSSDSDSESEPEMKQPEKFRKKKKKSKKQRDQEKQDRKPHSGEAEKHKEPPKNVSALPTITCAETCQDAGQPSIPTHKKHQCSNAKRLPSVLKASEKNAKLIPVREYDLPLLPWQITASKQGAEGLARDSFLNLLEHLKTREKSLKQQLNSLLSKKDENEQKEPDAKHGNLFDMDNIKPKRIEERKIKGRHHSLPNLPSQRENLKQTRRKTRTLTSAVALCSAYGIGGTISDSNYWHQPSATLEKLLRARQAPHFVSKYEGRRNGGIPCFSEERSVERAAKRMAEMRRRGEEEKQRDMAFFCDENGFCNCSRPLSLRRSLTHDELQCRLQVALNEGTANIAQTLVGFNVRTGYTHADSFRDLPATVMPGTMPQRDVSSSDSDSDSRVTQTTFPVSARRNPYQRDSSGEIRASPNLTFNSRTNIRTGPMLRSLSRHMSTGSMHPFMASNLLPVNAADPLSAEYSRVMQKTKMHRSPGPLIRGLKVPGQEEGD